jgi:hypothetical protein
MGIPIIDSLRRMWIAKTQRTPRVTPVAPVVKSGFTTGNSGEDETRFSASQRVKAGLYGKDGLLEDKKDPDLDGPP